MKIQDIVVSVEKCECPLSGRIPEGMDAVKIRGGTKKSLFSEFSKDQIYSEYSVKNLVDFLPEKNDEIEHNASIPLPSESTVQPEIELINAQSLVTMLMLACCQAINQNAADAAKGNAILWDFKPPAPPAMNAYRLNNQPEMVRAYLNGCTPEMLNEGISNLNQYLLNMKSKRDVAAVPEQSADVAFLTGLLVDKVQAPKATQFVFGQIFVAGAKNAKGLANPLLATLAVSASGAAPISNSSVAGSSSTTLVSSASTSVSSAPSPAGPSGTTISRVLHSEEVNRGQETKTRRESELSASMPATVNRETTVASLEASVRQLIQSQPAIIEKQTLQTKLATSEQGRAALLAYKKAREQADANARAAAQAADLPKPKTPQQIASAIRSTYTNSACYPRK